MLKKAVSLILLVFILVSVTGCWDTININDTNIITTILVDREDDQIVLYMEIANTDSSGKSSEDGGEKFVVVKAGGENIVEARANLDRRFDQPIYLGAARVLILTRNLTDFDIVDYFNRFRAEVKQRKKILTVTTDDKPEDIFKIGEASGESTGFYIEEMTKSLQDQGKIFLRPTGRYLENLSSNYSCFIIPSMSVDDNTIAHSGYSVVFGSRTIGNIPHEKSKGLHLLRVDNANLNYQIPFEDNYYTVRVQAKGRKVRPQYENDEVSFDVNLMFSIEVMYSNSRHPCSIDAEKLAGIRTEIEKVIKNDIEGTIYDSQKVHRCDYLGMDDEFQGSFPTEYEKLDWDKIYSDIPINVSIHSEIHTGNLMDYDHNETH